MLVKAKIATREMRAQHATADALILTGAAAVLPFEYGVPAPGRWTGLCRVSAMGLESGAVCELYECPSSRN